MEPQTRESDYSMGNSAWIFATISAAAFTVTFLLPSISARRKFSTATVWVNSPYLARYISYTSCASLISPFFVPFTSPSQLIALAEPAFWLTFAAASV